jgi:ribokinase
MATIDHLHRLADVGDLPEGKVLEYAIQGGGPAATAMAAASNLGADCGLVGCVGDDERGDLVISGLQEDGVDTAGVVIKAGRTTPMVLVLVDGKTGQRHFLALRAEPPRVEPEDVDWDYVAGAEAVVVDGWVREPGTMLARAVELGATTITDTEFRPDQTPGWLPEVDVHIAGADRPAFRNEPERAVRAAERLTGEGPTVVVITLGEAGCACGWEGGAAHIPGFEVDVVDTCGTGDVFRGGYAYAHVQGWSPRECATFASATSAISATALGGRAALPRAEEVAEFLLERSRTTGPCEQITQS